MALSNNRFEKKTLKREQMLSNKNTIKVQNKPQNEGSDEAQYAILATIF